MKQLILAISALALTASPALASAQSSIQGQWKNGPMTIEIAPCGSKLCGTVVKASPTQRAKAKQGSGTDLIGARLITDIERVGANTYRGHVFAADRNIHASGSIRQVSANELQVKGCVLALFCKSRTYERVR
jgi:uncharacterized protein (DUF2147 family)